MLIQENRTFDNLFATFPGADGTTVGKTHNGTIRLHKSNLESPISPRNGYAYWLEDYNRGRMNGFDLEPIGKDSRHVRLRLRQSRADSSRTGIWPTSTCWPIIRSRPRAAAASRLTKT